MANTRARPAQEIKVGSRVYYDQTAGIPAGLLDSIVVLDAGNGNRAVGRCNLDLTTARGLCTFSDRTGRTTSARLAPGRIFWPIPARWRSHHDGLQLSAALPQQRAMPRIAAARDLHKLQRQEADCAD
jgi:hypothetical protein